MGDKQMVYMVTGGSGCVGAYVMRDLIEKGKKVIKIKAFKQIF
jgi:nucleoside-diphosphate-sugar epimerase